LSFRSVYLSFIDCSNFDNADRIGSKSIVK
jgi:hypothetical protein